MNRNTNEMMKKRRWHFEISNIESLNVKYNLNTNIANIDMSVAPYAMMTIDNEYESICGTSMQVIPSISIIMLVMFNIMDEMSVMKYTIFMRISISRDDSCLMDIVNKTNNMMKHKGNMNVPGLIFSTNLH